MALYNFNTKSDAVKISLIRTVDLTYQKCIMTANGLSINEIKIEGESVTVIQYNSSTIHILGTSHLNPRFVVTVKELIKYAKPQVVGVELCRTRVGHKNKMIRAHRGKQSSEFNFEKIPKYLITTAVGEKLRLMYVYGSVKYEESKEFRISLLKYKRMKTYKLQKPTDAAGMFSIGAELLAPFNNLVWHADHLESKYLSNSYTNYKILLLDRPIEETFSAMAGALTPIQKALIKYYKEYFEDEFLSSESRRTIMNRLWRKNPKLHVIFIRHRDEHMAKVVVKAIAKDKIERLVCIVGRSHLSGLLEFLKRELGR